MRCRKCSSETELYRTGICLDCSKFWTILVFDKIPIMEQRKYRKKCLYCSESLDWGYYIKDRMFLIDGKEQIFCFDCCKKNQFT